MTATRTGRFFSSRNELISISHIAPDKFHSRSARRDSRPPSRTNWGDKRTVTIRTRTKLHAARRYKRFLSTQGGEFPILLRNGRVRWKARCLMRRRPLCSAAEYSLASPGLLRSPIRPPLSGDRAVVMARIFAVRERGGVSFTRLGTRLEVFDRAALPTSDRSFRSGS